jgi:hypothetical protein
MGKTLVLGVTALALFASAASTAMAQNGPATVTVARTSAASHWRLAARAAPLYGYAAPGPLYNYAAPAYGYTRPAYDAIGGQPRKRVQTGQQQPQQPQFP